MSIVKNLAYLCSQSTNPVGDDNFTCVFAFFSCAKSAKLHGYRFFGLQKYNECWAGELTSDFFDSNTKASTCWGVRPNYEECVDDVETKCVGSPRYNYIYEIVSGT